MKKIIYVLLVSSLSVFILTIFNLSSVNTILYAKKDPSKCATCDKLNAKISSLKLQLKEIEKQIKQLEPQAKNAAKQITDLKKQIAILEAEKKKEEAKIKFEREKLESQIKDIEQEITKQKNAFDNATSIETAVFIQKHLGMLYKALANRKSQLNNLLQNVNKIQAQIDKIKSEIKQQEAIIKQFKNAQSRKSRVEIEIITAEELLMEHIDYYH